MSDDIHAEIERELHHAIRRAWRQVASNWRDAEAEAVLFAATAAVSRRRPELDDEGVHAELLRLGVLQPAGAGQTLVAVPPLPGAVVVPAGSRAN